MSDQPTLRWFHPAAWIYLLQPDRPVVNATPTAVAVVVYAIPGLPQFDGTPGESYTPSGLPIWTLPIPQELLALLQLDADPIFIEGWYAAAPGWSRRGPYPNFTAAQRAAETARAMSTAIPGDQDVPANDPA